MSEPTQQMLNPIYRRLVLLFDGTWNKRSSQTNVARMFEAIDDYKPKNYNAETYTDKIPVQLVRYFSGVGTNIIGHIAGGVVGWGLSDIIKEAYCWLSNNYRVGDKIFVFGFSRGAYSARSLVSLVHRCGGVLARNGRLFEVDDDILKDAFAMYQSYVVTTDEDGIAKNDRKLNAAFTTTWNNFQKNYPNRVPVKVEMLGVWDTVGSLGIPDSMFKIKDPVLKRILYPFSKLADVVDYFFNFSRKHFAFHDQGLPCIVENAYHALALDEHREDFKPTLWDNVKQENKVVKQVWFIGSHANVGGGAATRSKEKDPDAAGNIDEDPDDLWQYSYIWMQTNASKHGLRFSFTHTPVGERADPDKPHVSYTTPEDSFENMGIPVMVPYFTWVEPYFTWVGPCFILVPSFKKIRVHLKKLYIWKYSWFHNREDGYRLANGSNGAKLHWSVKERIQQDNAEDGYHPESNIPREWNFPRREWNFPRREWLRIGRDGKSVTIQFKKRKDGKLWTEEEPEANFEWTEWPIEDEVSDENHKYNPDSRQLMTGCCCMKAPGILEVVPYSWIDWLEDILMNRGKPANQHYAKLKIS